MAPNSNLNPKVDISQGDSASLVNKKHRPTRMIIIDDMADHITYFTSDVALSIAGVVKDRGYVTNWKDRQK